MGSDDTSAVLLVFRLDEPGLRQGERFVDLTQALHYYGRDGVRAGRPKRMPRLFVRRDEWQPPEQAVGPVVGAAGVVPERRWGGRAEQVDADVLHLDQSTADSQV